MYAPLYRLARRHNIAPAVIDASPPHVVRWWLSAEDDPAAPETVDEYRAVVAERMAELEGRGTVAREPFDPSVLRMA